MIFIITYHIQENISYAFFDLTPHFFFFPGTTVVFLFFSYFLLTMERHISILLRLPTCYLFCFSNFCYFANFCVQPSRNVSRLSPYFSPFFLAMQEHSKPLRESLTYYLCAHEEKELIMPEIRQIAYQHVSFCFHFFLGFCFYVAILHALFFSITLSMTVIFSRIL